MNKMMTNTAAVLLAGLMSIGSAVAAEQKIAIVDMQSVAQQIPQMAAIDQTLKTEFGERMDAVNKLQKDIAFNIEKLRRDGATMSKEQQEELQNTIVKQRQDYETQTKPLGEEINRRRSMEINKVTALIRQAIDQVAAEKKYDLVLHKDAVAFLATADKMDISAAVAEKVGKLK